MDASKELYELIRSVVIKELNNQGLLTNPWRLGKVQSVISSTKLMVYVDGSTQAITIPCNPDVSFQVNDEVWVVQTSRDGKGKFVPFKRGI